jgi:hypothetical protein
MESHKGNILIAFKAIFVITVVFTFSLMCAIIYHINVHIDN